VSLIIKIYFTRAAGVSVDYSGMIIKIYFTRAAGVSVDYSGMIIKMQEWPQKYWHNYRAAGVSVNYSGIIIAAHWLIKKK
jgi:hypothetical protein